VGGGDAVDATTGLTVIDTTVFIIDLRYKRDRHFVTNRSFLDRMAQTRSGATSIFNLLEVCGILSFNLNEKQLQELFSYFPQRYSVEVFPHTTLQSPLPALQTSDLFNIILRKASFGDALIIAAIEKYIPRAARFVSWNARHFTGRLSIPSLTPREFLESAESVA
jgi:hypothetical protein